MVLCLTISSGHIGIWSSRRGGNQNTQTETSLSRSKMPGFELRLHWWEASPLTTVIPLLPIIQAKTIEWFCHTNRRCLPHIWSDFQNIDMWLVRGVTIIHTLFPHYKHSSSNKRPPSNKHPTPRPLYQIRAPLPHDSVPPPFPVTFLKK